MSHRARTALTWIAPLSALLLITIMVWRCTGTANTLLDQGLRVRHDAARVLSEHLVAVRAAQGDELLVAEIDTDLEIRERDTAYEWFTGLNLGTSEAAVKAPVRYRYKIHLSDAWRIQLGQEAVLIEAPQIRAVLPPAIDTAGLVSASANGWARFNAVELREKILRSLTAEAATRAASATLIDAARDKARSAVATFAATWILKAMPDRKPIITVRFPGEIAPVIAGAQLIALPAP